MNCNKVFKGLINENINFFEKKNGDMVLNESMVGPIARKECKKALPKGILREQICNKDDRQMAEFICKKANNTKDVNLEWQNDKCMCKLSGDAKHNIIDDHHEHDHHDYHKSSHDDKDDCIVSYERINMMPISKKFLL